LYLLREEGATALTRFVDGGGTLLAGPFTDVVDGHDQFRTGGFVTQLRDVLGIRFEDFGALGGASVGGMGVGALSAAAAPAVRATAGFTVGGTPAEGRLVAESIHAVGADVVSHFETGAAAGRPALTRHRHGAGEAWYIATLPDTAGADAVVAALVESSGVRPVVAGLPADVEVARRGELVTLINHGDDDVDIAIEGTDAETGAPVERVRLASQEAAFVLAPVVVAASGPLGLATASV
ncbi:MAG TPA: beta-galactosidase trimerization domain-containing protein, partial [Agromyces sp.]